MYSLCEPAVAKACGAQWLSLNMGEKGCPSLTIVSKLTSENIPKRDGFKTSFYFSHSSAFLPRHISCFGDHSKVPSFLYGSTERQRRLYVSQRH